MTYPEAISKLNGKSTRRLRGVATYLVQNADGTISVEYRNTPVVTFFPNGEVVLDSGGWRTATTKFRMNEYVPKGWYVYQDRYEWFISHGNFEQGTTWVYRDGCVLRPNGTVKGTTKYLPKKRRELQKKLRKFAKEYIRELFAGNIPAPSVGDCLYCHRFIDPKTEETVVPPSDHILSHLKERYYVPSLLLRAIEAFPVSPAAESVVSTIWNGSYDPGDDPWFGGGVVSEQLEKSLRRYLLRACGFAG